MYISILILFISLIAVYKLFSSNRSLTIIFFTLFPVFCTSLWITYESLDWFAWVKAYTLIAVVLAITMGRYLRFMNSRSLFNFIYVLLGLNILEAVVKDAYTLDLASAVNICTGLLLIFSLTGSSHDIHIDKSSSRDFIAPKLTLPWILVYTLWNWIFIYNEYTEYAPRHIAILAVPLMINFLKKGAWLQARAITLGFYVLLSITVSPFAGQWFPVMEYSEKTALFIATVNLFLWLCYRIDIRNREIKKWEKKVPSRNGVLINNLISLFKK